MAKLVEDFTLSIGEVAVMNHMSEPTFRKRRAMLEALGFPQKLPGSLRYSRPAVERWFRTNGGQAAAPEIEPSIDIAVQGVREQLEQEYAN